MGYEIESTRQASHSAMAAGWNALPDELQDIIAKPFSCGDLARLACTGRDGRRAANRRLDCLYPRQHFNVRAADNTGGDKLPLLIGGSPEDRRATLKSLNFSPSIQPPEVEHFALDSYSIKRSTGTGRMSADAQAVLMMLGFWSSQYGPKYAKQLVRNLSPAVLRDSMWMWQKLCCQRREAAFELRKSEKLEKLEWSQYKAHQKRALRNDLKISCALTIAVLFACSFAPTVAFPLEIIFVAHLWFAFLVYYFTDTPSYLKASRNSNTIPEVEVIRNSTLPPISIWDLKRHFLYTYEKDSLELAKNLKSQTKLSNQSL